jgi:hypothetical protein
MPKHHILGVHITNRLKDVPAVQAIFTEYGCNIKTRLGLHQVTGEYCAPNGIVILELVGDEGACKAMGAKLAAIEGVEVQSMVFD